MRVPFRCDYQLTIDDVSATAPNQCGIGKNRRRPADDQRRHQWGHRVYLSLQGTTGTRVFLDVSNNKI